MIFKIIFFTFLTVTISLAAPTREPIQDVTEHTDDINKWNLLKSQTKKLYSVKLSEIENTNSNDTDLIEDLKTDLINERKLVLNLIEQLQKTYEIIFEHYQHFYAEFDNFYRKIYNLLNNVELSDTNILNDVINRLNNFKKRVNKYKINSSNMILHNQSLGEIWEKLKDDVNKLTNIYKEAWEEIKDIAKIFTHFWNEHYNDIKKQTNELLTQAEKLYKSIVKDGKDLYDDFDKCYSRLKKTCVNLSTASKETYNDVMETLTILKQELKTKKKYWMVIKSLESSEVVEDAVEVAAVL